MREIVSPLDGIRSPFGSRRFAFSPLSLFASGEEGAWYEPSTTTAFAATATGTNGFTDIAPAGYGDLCAILLDKSQGAGYSGGSFTGVSETELVTNGTFDTDLTGWFGYNDTPVWDASGRMLISAPSEFDGAKTGDGAVTGFTVGKVYLLSCDIELGTAASAKVEIYAGAGPTLLARIEKSASGSYQAAFTATATTATIYAVSGTGAVGTAYFDNISVRELPGNHATQATSSARPILARVPETGRRNLLTGTDDLATQSVTVTAVEHVLSFFGTGTVTLTGASTAGPLVGTGADDRVSLTFTPSAGSLTLTVSGDVNFAQLEVA